MVRTEGRPWISVWLLFRCRCVAPRPRWISSQPSFSYQGNQVTRPVSAYWPSPMPKPKLSFCTWKNPAAQVRRWSVVASRTMMPGERSPSESPPGARSMKFSQRLLVWCSRPMGSFIQPARRVPKSGKSLIPAQTFVKLGLPMGVPLEAVSLSTLLAKSNSATHSKCWYMAPSIRIRARRKTAPSRSSPMPPRPNCTAWLAAFQPASN